MKRCAVCGRRIFNWARTASFTESVEGRTTRDDHVHWRCMPRYQWLKDFIRQYAPRRA